MQEQRRFLILKLLLKLILMSIVIFLIIPPRTGVTQGLEPYFNWEFRKEPSRGGELKLISMDIPQTGTISADVTYCAMIKFDAGFKPEVRRACFTFSGGKQSCIDVEAKDVTSGQFRVPIHIPLGSKRIQCYAEYIRDGKISRTNVITYYIITLNKSEE